MTKKKRRVTPGEASAVIIELRDAVDCRKWYSVIILDCAPNVFMTYIPACLGRYYYRARLMFHLVADLLLKKRVFFCGRFVQTTQRSAAQAQLVL